MGSYFCLAAPVLGVRLADRGVVSDGMVDVPRARSAGRSCGAWPRCAADVPLPAAGPPPAGADGLEAVRFALLAFNVALFVLTFGLLYAQQNCRSNPDGKGSLGALGYKDTAGSRTPGCRYRRRLQHGLLVRDQHQPPALLGRAASLVFQPARRHRLAAVRHAGGRPGGHAGRDPRACAATSIWATSTST